MAGSASFVAPIFLVVPTVRSALYASDSKYSQGSSGNKGVGAAMGGASRLLKGGTFRGDSSSGVEPAAAAAVAVVVAVAATARKAIPFAAAGGEGGLRELLPHRRQAPLPPRRCVAATSARSASSSSTSLRSSGGGSSRKRTSRAKTGRGTFCVFPSAKPILRRCGRGRPERRRAEEEQAAASRFGPRRPRVAGAVKPQRTRARKGPPLAFISEVRGQPYTFGRRLLLAAVFWDF